MLMGQGGQLIRRDRFHEQVKMMYSWSDTARRTEKVYNLITSDDQQSFALIDRLKRYYGCGVWAGKLFVICVIVDYLLYAFLELWYPRKNIDICRDWPKKELRVDEDDLIGLKESRNTIRRMVDSQDANTSGSSPEKIPL